MKKEEIEKIIEEMLPEKIKDFYGMDWDRRHHMTEKIKDTVLKHEPNLINDIVDKCFNEAGQKIIDHLGYMTLDCLNESIIDRIVNYCKDKFLSTNNNDRKIMKKLSAKKITRRIYDKFVDRTFYGDY